MNLGILRHEKFQAFLSLIKNIDLQIVEVLAVVILEKPFLLHLVLTSQTDKTMGPFEVFLFERDLGEKELVMINSI